MATATGTVNGPTLRAGRLGRAVGLLGLGVVAAWYFHGTIDYFLGWTDEGQTVYPSWQVAEGAVPYVSFGHLYAPSLFFVNAALFRIFGSDLRVVRLALVALKAGTTLLVFVLARRVARPTVALVAWAVLVAVWGAPGWFFNAPYATYYATPLCLAALCALGGGTRASRLVTAGALAGAAATFKQTQGVFAATSLLLFLVFAGGPRAAGRLARAFRVVVPLGAAALAVAYLRPHLGTATGTVLLLPLAAAAAVAARGDRAAHAAGDGRAIVFVVAGFAVPLAAYAVFYAQAGAVRALLDNTFGELPRRMQWFAPAPVPGVRSVLLAIAAAGSVVAAAAWCRGRDAPGGFRVAVAGLVVGGIALAVRAAMDPPLRSRLAHGNVLVDLLPVLGWLPFGLLAATARAVTRAGGGRLPALLWFYAAGAVLQFYPAADLPHAILVLPAFLPLMALGIERFLTVFAETAAVAPRAFATLVAIGWPLAVAAPYVANRLAIAPPAPANPGRFARATGIFDAPPKFDDAVALVRHLQREARPDGGALVLCNEQLLYFLAGVRSALPREEFVLYLVEGDMMSGENARALVREDGVVATLAASRPLVVDCPAMPAGGRFRAAFPAVARFLDAHYHAAAAFGGYQVLAFDGAPLVERR